MVQGERRRRTEEDLEPGIRTDCSAEGTGPGNSHRAALQHHYEGGLVGRGDGVSAGRETECGEMETERVRVRVDLWEAAAADRARQVCR